MSIHAALTHKTVYTYDRLIKLGPQIIRLRPAPHSRTKILSYSLVLEPVDHFLNWQQDAFGNFLARMVPQGRSDVFSVTVDLVADMAVINPFDFFLEEYAEGYPFNYTDMEARELAPYLAHDAPSANLADYLATVRPTLPDRTIDMVVALNQRLERDIDYVIRMEPGVQAPDQTLEKRSGSCRDTGWLLVHMLRNFGLAARFVSGYLIQLKPDQKPLDGPAGTDVDFTDLHAWAEVYLPGAGWVGLDPTSGLLAGEGHIPLAAAPHFASAAPITGAHEPADVSFDFEMHVSRIAETPRVTKPYSDEQWQKILMQGHRVDERLRAQDVRLTMGGEPTFVSIDDMDGAEWTNAAVGPTKRHYAEMLLRKLADRFGHDGIAGGLEGGLLHFGQGKWYPGEQLPRWAFALYWRRDGKPLWEDPSLVAPEAPPIPAGTADAERFSAELCRQMGLPADSAIPAYEDAAYFALAEQKLPVGVAVEDNRLEDEAERARLIRTFDRGVTNPTGYVLPIQVWQTKDRGRRWVTEHWTTRRGKLFLMPGDSPVGFRLPLGGLPYLAPVDYPHMTPRDPLSQHEQLPVRRDLHIRRRTVTLEAPPTAAQANAGEIVGSVRTAMAIEPRDGQLCVFMPPLEDAEDYAALAAAIEESARLTGLTVRIEGYEPPSDPRLNVIKVTPDPGVIEVNIHPAATWEEAVETTTTLYDVARECRLGTDKFMLDGRHTGTGGGNHIVLGGPTPADSPFLRRPDLLASIITYWQHHPSLSYLFSGLFIGPTSQAPRVDEARHEGLYELEIAFSQLPPPGAAPLPLWLVDRLFRNLLIDVTGNTHRAEICIDKLYSPDGPTGRLGLIEFRSFEMPPHARMSLAQQLLLRALIAKFWAEPYKGPLVRWGTDLHDRFMLPHFVWEDFRDVLRDLRAAGFDLEEAWFAPHFEFRFPAFGDVTHGGVTLEIRQALEPWHVLGEEGTIGGTARYVDSSLERLQVKAAGLVPGRNVVTCNGHAVALAPTGTTGEGVAGIRYRAWQPPNALHPTIPVHSPLVFDIVDSWSARSLGGCRYHVFHPGGKAAETFPINAYEAEGRRLARFESIGHTPGRIVPPLPVTNPDYPVTLDLRRTGM
jgi:uncharacterized protein (DUF2126 family)/transglutaminase-like putative cysteine protease